MLKQQALQEKLDLSILTGNGNFAGPSCEDLCQGICPTDGTGLQRLSWIERGGWIMRTAIFARYSSENQRPESIEDQIASCLKLTRDKWITVDDENVYYDQVTSGSRRNRDGLNALLEASPVATWLWNRSCDDLSRLAGTTSSCCLYLPISVLQRSMSILSQMGSTAPMTNRNLAFRFGAYSMNCNCKTWKKDSARTDRSEETKVLDGRKNIRIQIVSVLRNGQG